MAKAYNRSQVSEALLENQTRVRALMHSDAARRAINELLRVRSMFTAEENRVLIEASKVLNSIGSNLEADICNPIIFQEVDS